MDITDQRIAEIEANIDAGCVVKMKSKDDGGWPYDYITSDLRSIITRMRDAEAKVKALEAAVEKLHTADGVPMWECDQLHHPHHGTVHGHRYDNLWTLASPEKAAINASFGHIRPSGFVKGISVSECYSTKAASEAALAAKSGGG